MRKFGQTPEKIHANTKKLMHQPKKAGKILSFCQKLEDILSHLVPLICQIRFKKKGFLVIRENLSLIMILLIEKST